MRRTALILLLATALAVGCTGGTTTGDVTTSAPQSGPSDGSSPPVPTMPNVVDQSIKDARDQLSGLDLKIMWRTDYSAKDRGTVLEQTPDFGAQVAPGTTATLTVAVWPRIPKLADRSLDAIKKQLKKLTLRPVVIKRPSTQPQGTILKVSPASGRQVPGNTKVKISIVSPHLCGYPLNPWCFSLNGGSSVIYSPPIAICDWINCIPSFWDSTNGYVIQCVDGEFSHSGGVSGSCSSHGGNGRPLYKP